MNDESKVVEEIKKMYRTGDWKPEFCIYHAFSNGLRIGREAEREEIFGSSKIKPFIKAKGLLNKYVLEQIKEKVRNEERKEFFKEVEKIHIKRCRKCQEAEHDKRLAVCIERKEIQQFKSKGEDEK